MPPTTTNRDGYRPPSPLIPAVALALVAGLTVVFSWVGVGAPSSPPPGTEPSQSQFYSERPMQPVWWKCKCGQINFPWQGKCGKCGKKP